MTNEELIQQELENKFPFLKEKIRIQRARRLFADIPLDKFMEVFDYVAKHMDFPNLCTITGTDEGDNLGCYYHLAKRNGIILNLKSLTPKSNPKILSVSSYYPTAILYEREIHDLLGFDVQGLPEGPRYPLDENWPQGQYPLRKDWKGSAMDLPVQNSCAPKKEGK
ncbi:NADH-quinone oxidoreductase subunit C [Elusimicrobiota bacterium]